MKYAILCSFILGSASVAYGQTRMPPPTYNNGNSGNGWDNPQTRSPLTGTDPANRVGTFQIMLQAPPVITDNFQAIPHGFGLVSQGATFGYIGLSGGIGYTLSSLIEIGGAFQFSLVGSPSSWDLFGEPFIKLNLGPTFKTGAINPFVMAGLAFGAIGTPGADVGFFGGGGGSQVNGDLQIDIDPGVEWLVGGRWGFDFFIPIDVNVPLAGGTTGIGLGVGYGLVAYL